MASERQAYNGESARDTHCIAAHGKHILHIALIRDLALLLFTTCMYKTLTLLSVHLGKHSCASSTYHKSIVSSRRALLKPHPRHPNFWTCQTCLYHSTSPATYGASATNSPSGVAAQMLLGRADAYDGFIVSVDDLPADPEEFESRLQQSLQVCGCTALGLSILFCLCHSTLVR